MTESQHALPASKMPDSLLIIGAVALLVFVAAQFITPGYFDVVIPEGAGSDRAIIDPDSFRYAEASSPSLFSSDGTPALFNAMFEGLVSGDRTGGAVGIMAFILLTGGAFGVVLGTGAVDRGVITLLSHAGGGGPVFLAMLFALFSLGGAVFGMGEEAIPFVLMLLPVLGRLGYDNVVVVMITYVATQIGFASSWMNPFSVAIAQGIADLPLLSGMPLRIGLWLLCTLVGIVFCLRYAASARNPNHSATSEPLSGEKLGPGDWLVLLSLLATVAWLCWGVIAAGYYLSEIATQFMILGIVCGVIGTVFNLNNMNANSAVAAFRSGAADLLPAALVVGLAKGIVYLMGGDDPTQPSLLNTVLHVSGNALEGLPAAAAAWLMLVGQSVFNLFVTSGSGQAALTMPLMAPLSDLLGVTRQVAVLAFQLGDGFTNILVPTSAALMGCLGAARLDWFAWVRAVIGLYGLLFLIGSAFVIGAALFGYQ